MASYEQNKSSKLWSARFREIGDDNIECQRRLSGYRTKKEAQEAYRKYVNEQETARRLKASSEPQQPKALMTDLIHMYLEYARTRVKESSFYTMEAKINKNITPFFEGKYIDDIKPYNILEWQRSIDSFAYSYKSELRGYIVAIYRYGERYHDVKNIMISVEPFRNLEAKKEMMFWTKDEFLRFVSKCDDIMLNALFWTLYIVGCRKGEALALPWSDIDFNKKTISITKNVTRKCKNKPWAITTPKNISSNRTVDIPDRLCDILKAHKARQLAAHESMTFVFGGDRPLAENTLARAFKAAADAAGVKCIRIHDLRHSCASLLISQGVPISAVSGVLSYK